ncbi:MAG TPA: acyl-ACP thioesterase domain-containing protein [Verrucomicrobiae bacterium]|nr:acyl-ACP thioesterase domain-containing protein [Verrucomicrobiae bacterium]
MNGQIIEPGVWTEHFTVHSYDVDFKHAASLEALCRYFLEAAWNHAEALGVGFKNLLSQKKVWVLSRLLVKLERCPRWGDAVVLKTWPRLSTQVLALRDFEMLTPLGAPLAAGTSAWLVLDATTRKPQRLGKILSALGTLSGRRVLDTNPAKLTAFDAGSEVLRARVRYSDIDLNGHVNSARYIGWIFDSYSLEFHAAHFASLCEVNYLGETLAGSEISMRSNESVPGHFSHSLTKPSGDEVCRARVKWIKI